MDHRGDGSDRVEAPPYDVRRKRKRSRSRSRSPSVPRSNKVKHDLQKNFTPTKIPERSHDARMPVSSNGLEIARQNSTFQPEDGKRVTTETRSIQHCYHSPSTGRNSESVPSSTTATNSASKKDIWKHFESTKADEDMKGHLSLTHSAARAGRGLHTERVNLASDMRHDAKRAARNLHYESEISSIAPPPYSGDREEDSEPWNLALVAKRLREAPDVDTTNKDIAAFLGGTGVGKTTTIDFCCCAKMVEVMSEDPYDDTVRIDVCPSERENFLRIGHGKSMTKTIDLLISPAKQKRKNAQILFCGMNLVQLCVAFKTKLFLVLNLVFLADMPGSSDDNPMDKVINCVLRYRALKCARTVRPVLVIKLKDFDANRYQISKAMIEFVASCFQDVSHFSRILVLVTHAQPEDEQSIGKLRGLLARMSATPGLSVNACELLDYLQSQADLALTELQQRRVNVSNVRVVRPLDPANRAALLDFIAESASIEEPGAAFHFNLERDAENTIDGLVSAEYQNVCRWVSETFDFAKVGPVLLDMEEVGRRLGQSRGFEMSRKRILQANETLHNEIKRAVQTLLNTPLDCVDVKAEFEPLVSRFKAMQVIQQSTASLLQGWKSMDCLLWDYQRDLAAYIDVEKKKNSWEALDSCVQRVRLLGSSLECKAQEEIASANISSSIQLHSEIVRMFSDPAQVSDGLIELQKASFLLTGTEKEEATKAYERSLSILFETLKELSERVRQQSMDIEQSIVLSKEDKMAFHANVTKLYKFTRPDQCIDEFLPEEARSSSTGGFYLCFREHLRLEQEWDVLFSRQQLLQRFNLLSCLVHVEDDELRIKLQLHMDGLKAQIEGFLNGDFQSLQEALDDVLPLEECAAFETSQAYNAASIEKFNNALLTAAQLLQIDEINRDKLCTCRFARFFEEYSQRILHVEMKVKHGLSTLSTIQQSTAAYFVCHASALPSLRNIYESEKHQGLRIIVEQAHAVHESLLRTIKEQAMDLCKTVTAQSQSGYYCFGSSAGLKIADETLVKLDALDLILNSTGVSEGQTAKPLLNKLYADFLELHLSKFRFQAQESARAVKMDSMLEAYKNLLPSARAENLKHFHKDPRLLDELARGVAQAEAALIELADEHLDHMEVVTLLRNIKQLILWKSSDDFNSQGTHNSFLKDARDILMQKLDRGLQNAKTAMDQARYDNVADFLKKCSEAEQRIVLCDVNYHFKGEIKMAKKLANQIGWLDNEQIQRFCEIFERMEECLNSPLLDFLEESMRQELISAQQEVRTELGSYPTKFRDVLARRLVKKATYSDCDAILKVVIGIKFNFPKYFKDTAQYFDEHMKEIQDKFDDIESKDDELLQRLSVELVEIMSDLNIHGANCC